MPLIFSFIYQAVQDISTLSFKEYIEIICATYLAYKNEPDKKTIDRSRYTPAQIKVLEDSMAFNKMPEVLETRILNLKFKKPPSEFSKNIYNFEYITNLYGANKLHGTLPFGGSLSDQPNKIIEVFNVIGSVASELQILEQKKMEKRK